MTVEVMGTLLGAAIQGQIVASAHTLKHCSTQNMSGSYLGNSSGAEIVKSLHSQEYLSHAVSVSVPTQELRCAKNGAKSWLENIKVCHNDHVAKAGAVVSRSFTLCKKTKQQRVKKKRELNEKRDCFRLAPYLLTVCEF